MKLGEAIYKSQQSAKPGDAPKDAKKEEGKKTITLLMRTLKK